jgi:hypothetical protein
MPCLIITGPVTMARVTVTGPRGKAWTVAAPALVSSSEATLLPRDYYIDVSDRYYRFHFGRPSTPTEIEQGLAASPSDDLAPPTGVFLLARFGDDPAGCAGLHILLATAGTELIKTAPQVYLGRTGGSGRR